MQDRFKFRIGSNTQGKHLTDDDFWRLTDGIVKVIQQVEKVEKEKNDLLNKK